MRETEEDCCIFEELIDDSIKGVKKSFLHLLLQQQKYMSLKDKCSMRWHPLIIRFALSIKYSSTLIG